MVSSVIFSRSVNLDCGLFYWKYQLSGRAFALLPRWLPLQQGKQSVLQESGRSPGCDAAPVSLRLQLGAALAVACALTAEWAGRGSTGARWELGTRETTWCCFVGALLVPNPAGCSALMGAVSLGTSSAFPCYFQLLWKWGISIFSFLQWTHEMH